MPQERPASDPAPVDAEPQRTSAASAAAPEEATPPVQPTRDYVLEPQPEPERKDPVALDSNDDPPSDGSDDDPPSDEPYACAVLLARAITPQVLMLLWVALLALACYTRDRQGFNAASQVQFTVGPGCIPPPAAAPLSTRQQTTEQACPSITAPPTPLGPVVSPANFAEILVPQNTVDEKEAVPPIFHWKVSATTRAATCREAVRAPPHPPSHRATHAAGVDGSVWECPAFLGRPRAGWPCHGMLMEGVAPAPPRPTQAAAGTNGSAAPCVAGLNACTVHYLSGELFLALSPAWLHASSFGLLQSEEREYGCGGR
eukprot:COSAG01_NODE_533_length_15816_cov_4.518738_2_plen_315_part_00